MLSNEIFNTLRLSKDSRLFADGIFKLIFLCEYYCSLIQISVKFNPKGPITNILALITIMIADEATSNHLDQ